MTATRRNEKQTVIDIFNRRADDRIQRKQTQKQLLATIQQKNTQLAVLNHVNSRLGAELVILQKKLGIDHDNILQQLQAINQISAAFHCETEQMEYLDALLTAYDENNLKQKKLIAHLYSSLEDAEKKSQILVKDNQFLLGELQQKTKQVLQIYSKGFVDDNLTSAYSKLQRQTEIQMMENLRTENQYLLNNFRSLQVNFDKKQNELNQSKKKSDHYFQLYKKQSQQLKLALIKIDDLVKIKDVLQKKFDEITQENIELETAKQQLETKINRVQAQRKQFKDKYNLYRTTKFEQTERIGRDFETLKLDHEAAQKRQRQYFNKNMLLEKDLQNHRQDTKMLKRELQKTKSDFQQTLKMCQAYETKINVYSKKQNIMRENLEDNKQKLENALLEKDKAILKQKQLQKVLQNLKDRNRQEMQTLKNTFERLITEQNEKIRMLEQDKDDTNSIFYQNQCSLKHQIQKLKGENKLLREQNNRQVQSIKTNTGSQIVNKLRQLQEKNDSLIRMLNQKQRSFQEDLEHKEEIIRNLELDNRDLSKQVDKEKSIAREATNERTQYKSKIVSLQREKEDVEQQLLRVRRNVDTKLNAQSDTQQSRIRQLEQKLAQSIKKQKQIKAKTIEMLSKYNQIEEQIKLEYQNKINALNAENQILRKKLAKK